MESLFLFHVSLPDSSYVRFFLSISYQTVHVESGNVFRHRARLPLANYHIETTAYTTIHLDTWATLFIESLPANQNYPPPTS